MKFWLLFTVIAIGIAQFCSSASITTSAPTATVTADANTESSDTAEKFDKTDITQYPGVNRQWVTEFLINMKQASFRNPFSVSIEGLARFFSISFGIDFTKLNQTLFDRMRDTTGCGEHFPENRTFEECRTTAYTELIKDKSTEEVQSMLDEISNRFQDSLSAPESDTTKLKQLEYFVRCLTRPVPNLEEKHTLIDIVISVFYEKANISKRDACEFWTKSNGLQQDCSKYSNEKIKP